MPPRVLVHEIPKKSLRKISSISIESSWQAISGEVIEKLFKDGFLPIRYLRDGARYELGSVVMKQQRTIKDILFFKKPKARPLCMLEDLLASADDITCEVSTAMKRASVIDVGPDIRHIFDGSDVTRRGVKRVYLSLNKCKRQHLDRIGMARGNIVDLFSADAYGFGVEDLYLVNEVIYSQELHFKVLIGDGIVTFNKDIRWPIAFKLCKIQILYESVLGPIQDVSKHLNVRWRPYKRLHMVRTSFVGDIERGYGDDMLREQRRRQRAREPQLAADNFQM